MKLKFIVQTFLLLFCSGFLFAQTTYVFVGTYNNNPQKEGIAVYRLHPESGQLTKMSSVYGILNPSYLAIGNDRSYVYACTETRTKNSGYITSFRFDKATGILTQLNRQKTSGENPVYLVTDKENKHLLSVNYTEAGLDVFPLLPDGFVGSRLQAIAYQEGSNATDRQHTAHTHAVIFSPDYRHIFMPDLGADDIKSYRFNAALKQPLAIATLSRTTAAAASGPRHICFHPNGRNVYCIEEIGGSVSSYTYKDGILQFLERIPLHKGSGGNYNSADIHISPDGKFLYASNRGDENNIAIYSIRESGKLKFVGYQSTLGEHPRMFSITPDGQYLVVANQLSNNIVVFKRNATTGRLAVVKQKIKIEGPSCVQIKTYP